MPEETKRATTILISTMDSFANLCRQRNIKLVFAFHPLRSESLGLGNYQVKPLLAHCYENNLSYVDMASDLMLKGYSDQQIEELFWPLDGHFKNKGYLYLAEMISKSIEAQEDTARVS